VGFRGGNIVKLTVPLKFQDPLGHVGTSLEINNLSEGKYVFTVLSKTLSTHNEQVRFLEQIAEYLSFLMARREANPHYGTSFIRPTWFEFNADYIPDDASGFQDGLKISDALAIESTRTVNLHEKDLAGAIHTDLLRFYVDGLRAEHGKSKYFHWFLILEYLENSDKYRALFSASKLFDETETNLIREVADKMDGPKKGAILNLLSRTKEFRNYKLANILHNLGIVSIKPFVESIAVTEDVIKGITDGRNALFHNGSKIPEDVLWRNLFPLATLVVEHVSSNPTCLDT